MTETAKIIHTGRPIKALLCLVACWFVGRVIVDNYGVETPEPPLNFVGYTHASELPRLKLPTLSSSALPHNIADSRLPKVHLRRATPVRITNIVEMNGIMKNDDCDLDRRPSGSRVIGAGVSSVQNAGFIVPAIAQIPTLVASNEYSTMPSMGRQLNQKSNSSWSGYSWLFARAKGLGERRSKSPQEEKLTSPSANSPAYGGSQAGAILSYRLIGNRQNGLFTYGRISTAIGVRDHIIAQEELALGVKVKPWNGIPISIHAEQRFAMKNDHNLGRAIYFAGGSGPTTIFEQFQLEAYGQGGFVLAERNIYFFDGFATLQRPVVELQQAKFAVGIGLWTGGQSNVSRIDVGPRADMRIPVGTGIARVTVDWRQKMAGNATPKSGLAVTVATGF